MSSVSMQTEKSRRDEYSFRREDEGFEKDDDDDENNETILWHDELFLLLDEK